MQPLGFLEGEKVPKVVHGASRPQRYSTLKLWRRASLALIHIECVEGVFSEVRLKLTHYCGNTSLSSSITSVKVSSISNGKRIMPLFSPLCSK